jgi:tetratricopeptide (TPR) repeat protein
LSLAMAAPRTVPDGKDPRPSEAGDLILDCHRNTLKLCEELAAADPNNPRWQGNIAVCHFRIGLIHKARGDLPAALASHSLAYAIIRRGAKTNSGNKWWQKNLFASFANIGDIQKELGNLSAAMTSYRRAHAIAERFAKSYPSDQDWQANLERSKTWYQIIDAWHYARTARHNNSGLVPPRAVQDLRGGISTPDQGADPKEHETDLSDARLLYAEARKRGYTVESAIEALERQAKSETTGRASPEPRPQITGNSPRRRTRYVFTEQELHDPDTIDRAYDILADCEEKRRLGQPLSEAQVQDRRWADAFKRKLRKVNGPEVG